jgi:hypothetical protein
MLYTQEEINSIHANAGAEFNRVYTSYEGVDYIGTQDGRLVLYYAPAETTVVSTVDDTVEDEVVEDDVILSYFEPALDEDFQLVLQPIDPISSILFGNVFTLDTDEGVLMPSDNTSYTDVYTEFEGADCITPKENITL